MKKISTRWILYLLTERQKHLMVKKQPKHCLKFILNTLIAKFVIGVETRVHFY